MPFSGVTGMLAAWLVGPAGVGCFWWWRRRQRARRPPAMGADLLRGPGHSERERLDEEQVRVARDLFLLCLVPLLFLLAYRLFPRASDFHRPWAESLVGLAFGAWMTWRVLRGLARIDRGRAAFDAQRTVGQELDQLMRGGAAVFHDFPADGFNIDHVVVSTQGVFAVTTRAVEPHRRGRGRAGATVRFDGHVLAFPKRSTSEPLEQAQRHAQWLSVWATGSVGGMVCVTPVLALPGWFVDRTGRSPVMVYSGRALGSLLNTPSKQPLSELDVERIAHQVEQRCRTAGPPLNGAAPPRAVDA